MSVVVIVASLALFLNYTLDDANVKPTIITSNVNRYVTSPDDWGAHSGVTGGIMPVITFDLPSEIRVGEPFEINIPYSYVGFDDGEVDWVIEYPGTRLMEESMFGDGPGTRIVVGFPNELTLLNNPEFESIYQKQNYAWGTSFTSMSKFIPYDITQEHNIKLVFNMTEPVLYPIEKFELGVDSITDDYYINANTDGTFSINLDREPPKFAPGVEPQPLCPECGSEPYDETSIVPIDPDFDPMRPDMEDMYKMIAGNYDDIFHYLQYETIEDMLRDNFASDWVDEFLIKYPEFKVQSTMFNPVLNFLLPSAYGQAQYVAVTGKILIQSDNRQYLPPNTQITACLVDRNILTNTVTILKNGLTDACKAVSKDGSFTFFADGDDPDSTDPSDRADIQIHFHLENSKIKLVDKLGRFTYYMSYATDDNASTILNLGTIKISSVEDVAKSYKIFDTANDGYLFFEKLGHDLPSQTIQYHKNEKNVGWSYQHGTDGTGLIKLQDYKEKKIRDSPVMILHETAGHHVQHDIYLRLGHNGLQK